MRLFKKILGVEIKEGWEDEVYKIIFKSTTARGRKFDLQLLAAIILSVIVVLLDSIPSIHSRFGLIMRSLEWFFTILFTVEYYLRIKVSRNKWMYILSVFGVIDLVSILPSYLSIIDSDFQYLLVFRSLRLLRVFKILNMKGFISASRIISKALSKSYQKIIIFMLFIIILVIILGSIMFIVEQGTPGFESIPNAIYWAVVTVTTVGYGDVAPITPIGKFLAIIIMIGGYSIIAVPTGILSAEMLRGAIEPTNKSRNKKANIKIITCTKCGQSVHLKGARYCSKCGEKLLGLESLPEQDGEEDADEFDD